MLAPKKSLGQNFLRHPHVAGWIAEAALLSHDDVVLEVGPGTGILTKELLARARKVYAVEKDARALPLLEETFATDIKEGRLVLKEGDGLKERPETLGMEVPYKVVANIPYYLSGALIEHLVTLRPSPTDVVLLVQKEVGERIARSKKESILSLSVKAYGTPSYVRTVRRGNFFPAPSVDSAILAIRGVSRKNFETLPEETFFAVVKAGFAEKRKRLAKNLERLAPREVIRKAFERMGVGENTRAEQIPLDTWLLLANDLSPHIRIEEV